MQGAFISALTYRPPVVLGKQLLPLSPWHGLILEAAASPYLIGGIPKLDDLVLGVWICSKSFSDGFAVAADPVAAYKWGTSLKQPRFSDEMIAFHEYIEISFLAPEYWRGATSGGSIKAPYFWHCARFAMRELNMNETQAWDYSIARIACYLACVAEINGNKDLKSADEIKGIEILKVDELKLKEIK